MAASATDMARALVAAARQTAPHRIALSALLLEAWVPDLSVKATSQGRTSHHPYFSTVTSSAAQNPA